MPPPGAFPPGYSNDHIPRSFMNKIPVPEGADTNTRPYLIFFGYLSLCAGLTVYVIQKLLKNYIVLAKSPTARPPPRKHVLIFIGLAASSLLTTWYYMIQYFKVSYKTWLMWRSYYEFTNDMNHWGLWLKHTSLFKEAWEIAIVGNARYWWTHQIFFFACALGLALEQKGFRRGIKHTWVFMVIGQLVAVSFATNLFLIALLLSPSAPPPPSTSASNRRRWLGPWLINFFAIIFTQWPAYLLADDQYWHRKPFLPVLLVAHLALLVLPFLRLIIPAGYFRDDDVEFMEGMYKYLWGGTIFGGALLYWKVSSLAYNYGGIVGMINALLEHPAVSSVGFDVIFCWVTWFMWWKINRTAPEEDDDGAFEKANDDGWTGVGSTTTVGVGDEGHVTRRR